VNRSWKSRRRTSQLCGFRPFEWTFVDFSVTNLGPASIAAMISSASSTGHSNCDRQTDWKQPNSTDRA
jgi:hypothetical protein